MWRIGFFKQEEAGEGGAAGGAAGGQPPIDPKEFEALKAERDAMKGKLDELLTETKKAKDARREAEANAAREAEERARKAGDFEQLHKSSETERQRLMSELDGMRANIANEKRDNAAMKLATELADGHNAELLKEFLARRLKYTDDGLKVTDQSGQLTVSTLADLKNEFSNDAKYAALLKGNQSSGGGAPGSAKGGGAAGAKTITRSEFAGLDPATQMRHIKSGGKIVD